LPYLVDVARFEWALNIAAAVRKAAPLQIEALAAFPAEKAAYVTLRLQPSLSYFVSSWPIDAIWQANQKDEVPPVDLAGGGAELEIRRAGDVAAWRRLDSGTFAFRTALADGLVLAAAMAAGTLRDPAFDPTAALQHVIAEGLAVACCLSPEAEARG
jgi:hypothetical protein